MDIESIKARAFRPPKDWARRGEMTRIVLSILRQAVEPLTTRDIALQLLVERALDQHDQRLLRLMTKRVGVALRLQRDNGVVRSYEGPGQYNLFGGRTLKPVPRTCELSGFCGYLFRDLRTIGHTMWSHTLAEARDMVHATRLRPVERPGFPSRSRGRAHRRLGGVARRYGRKRAMNLPSSRSCIWGGPHGSPFFCARIGEHRNILRSVSHQVKSRIRLGFESPLAYARDMAREKTPTTREVHNARR